MENARPALGIVEKDGKKKKSTKRTDPTGPQQKGIESAGPTIRAKKTTKDRTEGDLNNKGHYS